MTSALEDLVDGGICVNCGFSHLPEHRRRRIARLLPATTEDLREAWPCCYERSAAGNRRLGRDLVALGARFERRGIYRGMWCLGGAPGASSGAARMERCP